MDLISLNIGNVKAMLHSKRIVKERNMVVGLIYMNVHAQKIEKKQT